MNDLKTTSAHKKYRTVPYRTVPYRTVPDRLKCLDLQKIYPSRDTVPVTNTYVVLIVVEIKHGNNSVRKINLGINLFSKVPLSHEETFFAS